MAATQDPWEPLPAARVVEHVGRDCPRAVDHESADVTARPLARELA